MLVRDTEEMRPAYLSFIGATLVAVFVTADLAETPAQPASGIEGTIAVSPTHGGPIRIDEPSAVPVGGTKFLVKAGDATVATFTTDGAGHFQIALPPGHYAVMREGAAPRIGRWRFEADVVAGQMTKVNWTADSGMR